MKSLVFFNLEAIVEMVSVFCQNKTPKTDVEKQMLSLIFQFCVKNPEPDPPCLARGPIEEKRLESSYPSDLLAEHGH